MRTRLPSWSAVASLRDTAFGRLWTFKWRLTLGSVIATGCLLTHPVLAQSPVALTINTQAPGPTVPPDFGVFSFETDNLEYTNKKRHSTGYFFNVTNTQLLTLFQNVGVKSLRIGGDSVDGTYIPSTNDIDSYFAFARVANVKSVFSLDLAHGTPSEDATMARYIWQNYRTNVICLAIGNEPNQYRVNGQNHSITNFSTFMKTWERYASDVVRAVPDIQLGGPDNDGAATSWTSRFLRREQGSANFSCLLYHYKPLKSANNKTMEQLIAGELSPDLDTSNYPSCYNEIGDVARSHGLPYRFSEFNDYVAPAKIQLRDYSFAAALFALDALHWWAAHDCSGVYFHTWSNGFHAAFYNDSNGKFQLYPLGYGIAAFSVGGFGNVEPLAMSNVEGLNLTAYAIKNGTNLFVTVINKEYDTHARSAAVTIAPTGLPSGNVSAMFLVQKDGDVAATNGVTLGGAPISSAAPWDGQWTSMGALTNGQCVIDVPALSAVVVKISTGRVNLAKREKAH
ncbi:MAG TPA: glycosyl hydrolase family 79 C-terminal domain-containing protein [Candidatus Sulfotelmatobacter sp.]|nr:glycosyl hydrolase family 79 C-terminal domain-containing protein [Candidatus Sulfotelmatobacter sp.]